MSGSWARDKRRPPLPQIVLLFLGPLLLSHHYYSSSSASKGKQESSVSHCWATIARQRSEFASETSIWPCLTASNHEIHYSPSWSQIYSPADLRIHHVGCPELLGQLSLIPKLCYLSGASRSDTRILSTWQKKTAVAINLEPSSNTRRGGVKRSSLMTKITCFFEIQ